VGIGRNESRRQRSVQHARSSHQSVRPSGNSHHQTVCSLQRTVNYLLVLTAPWITIMMLVASTVAFGDEIFPPTPITGHSANTQKFGLNWTTLFKNADFQSIIARSTLAVTFSEKGSVTTNKKFTTRFPMGLRWTVASKSPKGGLENAKWTLFLQSVLFSKIFCYKVFYMKTASVNVVRYSVTYLSVQKWLVGDVSLNIKFLLKVNVNARANASHVDKQRNTRHISSASQPLQCGIEYITTMPINKPQLRYVNEL